MGRWLLKRTIWSFTTQCPIFSGRVNVFFSPCRDKIVYPKIIGLPSSSNRSGASTFVAAYLLIYGKAAMSGGNAGKKMGVRDTSESSTLTLPVSSLKRLVTQLILFACGM